WANGSGATVGTTMAMAQSQALTNQLWPLLENQVDYKTISDSPTLQNQAQADLNAHQTDPVQWTLTVDAQSAPQLGSYLLGDACKIRVANHIWIPDGDYVKRIIGISGDNTATVK